MSSDSSSTPGVRSDEKSAGDEDAGVFHYALGGVEGFVVDASDYA